MEVASHTSLQQLTLGGVGQDELCKGDGREISAAGGKATVQRFRPPAAAASGISEEDHLRGGGLRTADFVKAIEWHISSGDG